jgi:hypothetical protein
VVGVAGEFDRSLTPEEIMDRLEKRVGPEGRKLFEQFLRKVNKLQVQQHLEARAQGDTERLSNRVDVTPFRQAAVRPKR